MVWMWSVVACTPTSDTQKETGNAEETGTTDDSGTTVETAESGESGDTAETGDTGTPLPTEAAATDLTWATLPQVGSVGVVTWSQTAEASAAWVEFRTDGGDWSASPSQVGSVGTLQGYVLGVPYAADVEFRIVNDFGAGAVATASETGTTAPLPDGIELPVTTTPLPDQLDPDLHFLLLGIGLAEQNWKLILDRQGRVVWAHPSAGDTGSMIVSITGDHIVWDDGASIVNRMTLDGTISETVDLTGLHHTFTEGKDGVLVWGGKEAERDSVWERATDGTVRRIFDCATYWEENGASKPCDGNTLFWNPSDDTLLFSSDNDNTVMHLDRTTGAVLHQFGQLPGSWAFASPDHQWWKQHSPLWTAEGTLMVSSWHSEADHTLLSREYSLDEATQTLTQIWSCDTSSGIEADYSGETRRLAGGNTLLNYGPGGVIREYSPDCAVVWELAWSEGTSTRKMAELRDLYPLLGL